MPFIRYDQQPLSIGSGRFATDVSYEDDTAANWVAEVSEVLHGETEIAAAAFKSASDANRAHNAAIVVPVIAPPEDRPSLLDILIASKTLDAADKAALAELRG